MSSKITITDAAVAAVAAEALFEKARLYSTSNELVDFIDAPYPIGLIDPTTHILKELKSLNDRNKISALISIGSGRPAYDDINDPRLGYPLTFL